MAAPHSSGLSAGIGSERPGRRMRTTFYVEVPDLQAALDRAVAMGGQLIAPPMTIPRTSIAPAQLTDPDGNVVSLVHGMR
jgi:uncharacterized protein